MTNRPEGEPLTPASMDEWTAELVARATVGGAEELGERSGGRLLTV